MEKKVGIKKIMTPEWVFPAVHFIASFFYEWTILLLHPAKNTVTAFAKDMTYSDGFERIMGYGLAKLFAALIIYFTWKLIFYLVRNVKKDVALRFFCAFFIVGLVLLFFLWPNVFYYSDDNYVTYSYAIRLFPEYWHNAYTSIVYCACLMVLPHPISICLFQWLFFVFNLAYVFHRLGRSRFTGRKTRWFVFFLFLMPETFLLFSDPYRTELYALLCISYVFTILMDIVDERTYSSAKLIGMAFLSAFVAVWRTEGIILGFLAYVAILLFVNHVNWKKFLFFLLTFVFAFVIVGFPQKVGNVKYYGSDYSIINSFPSLQNVLNRKDSNLSYNGAREDLAAIDAVVPLEAVQVYGMDGYRRHNAMNGNADINQSLTSMEAGKQYVRSFYRLVLHNPMTYIRTQIGMLKMVLKLRTEGYVEGTSIVLSQDYPAWTFPAWNDGREDLMRYPLVQAWDASPVRSAFAKAVIRAWNNAEAFFARIYVIPLILILIPLMEGILFLRECVAFWKNRKKKKAFVHLSFAFFAMTLLGQFAAIALVMPAGVLTYFHAVYYCSLVLEIVYFSYGRKKE